jgi:hypothetical protein
LTGGDTMNVWIHKYPFPGAPYLEHRGTMVSFRPERHEATVVVSGKIVCKNIKWVWVSYPYSGVIPIAFDDARRLPEPPEGHLD